MKKKLKTGSIRIQTMVFLWITGLSLTVITGCGNSNDKPVATQVDTNTAKMDTVQSASIKEKLLGSWISKVNDLTTVKMVFTKDSMTRYNNGSFDASYSYKWVNDTTFEIVMSTTNFKVDVAVNGDQMMMEYLDSPLPKENYKREQASTATGQNSQGQTPAEMLIGKWTMTSERKTKTMEFNSKNEYNWKMVETNEDPQFGPHTSKGTLSYRFVNGNTVEVFNYYSKEISESATFNLEDAGNTLAWTSNGETVKFKREKTN